MTADSGREDNDMIVLEELGGVWHEMKTKTKNFLTTVMCKYV